VAAVLRITVAAVVLVGIALPFLVSCLAGDQEQNLLK
jgi:hypothetical protein